MRAVRLHGTGPRATLEVDDVAPPRPPRGDEVLVRVSASSVNGTDTGIAGGSLPLSGLRTAARPLGFDLVGEVVALGPRTASLALGDTVVALVEAGELVVPVDATYPLEEAAAHRHVGGGVRGKVVVLVRGPA